MRPTKVMMVFMGVVKMEKENSFSCYLEGGGVVDGMRD